MCKMYMLIGIYPIDTFELIVLDLMELFVSYRFYLVGQMHLETGEMVSMAEEISVHLALI